MRSSLLTRATSILAALLIAVGAAGIVAGTFSPWANVTLFKNIDIAIPGLFFMQGGLCLAVAALTLLRMRRSPLLCLIASLFVLNWSFEARNVIPHFVKHQVIGADMALFPINRLLDQFHIPNLEVSDRTIPNDRLLGPGVQWTLDGGTILLLGGVLGFPTDPFVVWVWRSTARARCRACGARWPLRRNAEFCPECGTSTVPINKRICPTCHTPAAKRDHHCIQCGTALGNPS